jgi:hypothetical protein
MMVNRVQIRGFEGDLESFPIVQQSTVIVAYSPDQYTVGASWRRGRLLVAADLLWSVWFNYVNHQGDTLPGKDDLSDPRIVDSDGDGKPGATLKVGNACDVHVLQRAISALDGVVEAPGRIVGQGMHATQQVVLSATSSICAAKFKTRPNDAHNHFVLVRVDGDGLDLDSDADGHVSCAEIIAAQGQFVTWREPDNAACALSNDPPG